MYHCDQNELEDFIEKVRELANANHKLALLAIDQEDGRLAADIETLPKPKNCESMCCDDKDDDFPPLMLPATEIKRSLCFSVTTYKRNPTETLICGTNIHGQYVCYPPW